MLKLFRILQYWLYKQWNFLSYTFIFRKQFYFVASGLKITDHENPDNNLEWPCISKLNLSTVKASNLFPQIMQFDTNAMFEK
jgi:hypothetical protein